MFAHAYAYGAKKRVKVVAPTSAPANTVAPVVSGDLHQGQLLSCTTGSWSNSPTSYAYQWKRNGTNLGGATSSTYTTVSGDIGQSVKCTVTATNIIGSGTPQDSNTVTVLPQVPAISVAPVVSGTPEDGQTLSCTTGTWTNTPSGYTYQWKADAVNIGGATASTFLLTATQIGAMMTCAVVASNAGGSGSASTSNSVGPVDVASFDYSDGVVANGLEDVRDYARTGMQPGPRYSLLHTLSTDSVAGIVTGGATVTKNSPATGDLLVNTGAGGSVTFDRWDIDGWDVYVIGTGTLNITDCTWTPKLASNTWGLSSGRDGPGNSPQGSPTVNVTFADFDSSTGGGGAGFLRITGSLNVTDCSLRNVGTQAIQSDNVSSGTITVARCYIPFIGVGTNNGVPGFPAQFEADTGSHLEPVKMNRPPSGAILIEETCFDLTGAPNLGGGYTASAIVLLGFEGVSDMTVRRNVIFGQDTTTLSGSTPDSRAPHYAFVANAYDSYSYALVFEDNAVEPGLSGYLSWGDDGATPAATVYGSGNVDYATGDPITEMNLAPPTPSAPVNTVAPSISGSGEVNAALTATPGTWTGYPTPTITGEWFVDGVATGDTDLNFTPDIGDLGLDVTYLETAENTEGTDDALSNAIEVIAESGGAAAIWDSAWAAAGIAPSNADKTAKNDTSDNPPYRLTRCSTILPTKGYCALENWKFGKGNDMGNNTAFGIGNGSSANNDYHDSGATLVFPSTAYELGSSRTYANQAYAWGGSPTAAYRFLICWDLNAGADDGQFWIIRADGTILGSVAGGDDPLTATGGFRVPSGTLYLQSFLSELNDEATLDGSAVHATWSTIVAGLEGDGFVSLDSVS